MAREKARKVSFCLPVYNVKEYLEECIESIYQQGLSDFEIICIDDCSTDGSFEKLKRLAENHPEMIVCQNDENKGISYTRNRAVAVSNGEGYIWFVDPDDKLVPNTALLYLDIAEKNKVDAVLGKAIRFMDNTKPPVIKGTDHYEIVDYSNPDKFYDYGPNFGVWNGIIEKSFFMKNELHFHEDLPVFEEVLFYVEFGVKVNKIARVDHYGYYYRTRSTSMSRNRNAIRLYNYAGSAKIILPILKSLMGEYPQYKASLRAVTVCAEKIYELNLARIPDSTYIRQSLKYMKSEGFYPHDNHCSAHMVKSRSWKYKLLFLLLRIEPCFWLVHYVYKLLNRIKTRCFDEIGKDPGNGRSSCCGGKWNGTQACDRPLLQRNPKEQPGEVHRRQQHFLS